MLPHAYAHPPQANLEVRHPVHGDQTVHAHGDGRRWGMQAPEEYKEMEEYEDDEDDGDDYGSQGSEGYDDDEEFED